MALSVLIDGNELVASLKRGSLSITVTSGDSKGRADFTLLASSASAVVSTSASVVIADGATSYFSGTIYNADYTERKQDPTPFAISTNGGWELHITAVDAGPAASTTDAPFALSSYTPEQTYINGVVNTWVTPLVFYRLGEANGTTATDQRGYRNGTYVGSPTLGATSAMTTSTDKAVTLDGSSQYITVGTNLLRGQANLTIAAWAKSSSADVTQSIYCERGTTNDIIRFHLDNNGRPVFQWRNDAGTLDTVTPSSGDWTDGNWHHFAVTKTGTAVKIIVDGVTVKTATLTATNTQTETCTVNIGRDSSGVGYFPGSLDEVMLFNTAQPDYDIRRIYACRNVKNYQSLTNAWWYDGTTGGITGTVETFDYGLLPGQLLALTSGNFKLTSTEFVVREVTTHWVNKTTPLYSATYGDTPVHLAAAFP
jgi:hypothetical protein